VKAQALPFLLCSADVYPLHGSLPVVLYERREAGFGGIEFLTSELARRVY